MGISRKMKDKNWTDSQGRKGKVRERAESEGGGVCSGGGDRSRAPRVWPGAARGGFPVPVRPLRSALGQAGRALACGAARPRRLRAHCGGRGCMRERKKTPHRPLGHLTLHPSIPLSLSSPSPTPRATASTASPTSTAPTWTATPPSTLPTPGPSRARRTSWAPRAWSRGLASSPSCWRSAPT